MTADIFHVGEVPCVDGSDLTMSRSIVVIVSIGSSSESWEP
jgi:hypothetical protein